MAEAISQRPTVIHGPIRYIVRSAHKWGGNGTKPDFHKIKRVLASKHPEVIAKVFQGDADKAAAWIKDAWYRYWGVMLKGKTGVGPTYWRGPDTRKKIEAQVKAIGSKVKLSREDTLADLLLEYQPVPAEFFEEAELFLADSKAQKSKDGLVWLAATRTGTWKRNPIPGRTGPLVIDESLLEAAVQNFEAGAWEHVTVPLADEDDDTVHKDLTRFNTGYVRRLKVVDNPKGGKILAAGVEFTEPDVEEKVMHGSIGGRSVGMALSPVTRTSDGKTFTGGVLKHIALTNKPWVDGLPTKPLDPETLAASLLEEDEVETEIPFDDLDEMEITVDDEAIAAMIEGEEIEDGDWDVATAILEAGEDDEVMAAIANEDPVELMLAQLTPENRKKWAKEGIALPDGSYPIPDIGFLKKAIKAFGRAVAAGKGAKVKAHIIKRARALKATNLIPKQWSTANLSKGTEVTDEDIELLLAIVGEKPTVDSGAPEGTFPPEANYRVATLRGQNCGNCQYWDYDGGGNGTYAGHCLKWDAPAASDHVSDGFVAEQVHVMASRKEGPVVRLVAPPSGDAVVRIRG